MALWRELFACEVEALFFVRVPSMNGIVGY